MTTDEFSNAFDTLLNSYNSDFEFGTTHSQYDIVLDEYEKSVFLTKAQEQIVTELYSGRNNFGASFEETEELRSKLRAIIKTQELVKCTDESELYKVHPNSQFFYLPDDVLFITYEEAILDDEKSGCKNNTMISVVPITQDEFHKTVNNPFRQANLRRALRLDYNDSTLEIVSNYNIGKYILRYLKKPTPIVLGDFSEMGAFKKVDCKRTECILDPMLHQLILERAVLLAIQSKGQQSRTQNV